MTQDQIMLGLSLMTRDASNFLKTTKSQNLYGLKKQFHGAKKNLMQFLLAKYPVLEYRRIAQFNLNVKSFQQPMCLIKLTVRILEQDVTFHTPQEDFTPIADIKYTTENVLILNGKIPPTDKPIIKNSDDVVILTNRLNSMSTLLWGGDHIKHHGTIMLRLGTFIQTYASEETLSKIYTYDNI